jgi:hypothetical protein
MQQVRAELAMSKARSMGGPLGLRRWLHPADYGLIGHIQSLETFVPRTPNAFDGVHFVEFDLAELSGLWGKPPDDYQEGNAAWSAHSVEERVALMGAGYRTCCSEVGHVDIDSIWLVAQGGFVGLLWSL